MGRQTSADGSFVNYTHTLLQGVVAYASLVEAFANGIKIESSDQGSFLGENQGIRM